MGGLEIAVLAVAFVVLLLWGVPISYAIALATLATMLVSIPAMPALTTEVQRIATGLDSFALLAVPFFILAGHLMNHGGVATRLIRLARAVLGGLPGGLAHVNILASMLFGAVSGSSVAAASAVGSVMTPEMSKDGYDREFGAAVNVTAATTGLLIPPSNVLIVYSLASGGVSIAALFMAGYLPGILVGLMLMGVAAYKAKKLGYGAAGTAHREPLGAALIDALPSLFMLFVVIGGIVAGIFTATEAAAIAVVYALVLALVYREVGWRDLPRIVLDASEMTAVVLLLVATSIGMSWIMAYVKLPAAVTGALLAVGGNEIVVLLLINVVLLMVGTFMDITPALLIFTPMFLPLAVEMGIDPVHFGIIMVLNLCIGICTPPVGSVLFVGVGVAGTTITRIVKPLLPFYAAMVIALILVTYWPALSMWLPGLLGL
ncbi:MAG: TRAP transporter large permease subunit [Rhodothermales bacterium]|nr:TRAP transporter large permease subunit [Rhodothermales bacterium]